MLDWNGYQPRPAPRVTHARHKKKTSIETLADAGREIERRAYKRAATLAEFHAKAWQRQLADRIKANTDDEAIKLAAIQAELCRSIAHEIRGLIEAPLT